MVPSTCYQVPGTKYLVPSTWYRVLGTKYLVPSTWYQVLGTRYLVPEGLLKGPIWVLKGPIWVLKGPIWVLKGPQRSQMGPQNGKCAETARGVFRNEGGVQIRVGISVKPRVKGYILIWSSDGVGWGGGLTYMALWPAYGYALRLQGL